MEHLPLELQSLVDIHDQPFVIIDDDHRVVIVNRAFEETYGVSIADASGTPCHELVVHRNWPSPCDPRGERCPFAETFTKQVASATSHTYRDSEGREHLVRIQGYPIRTRNGRVYLGELIQRDAVRHRPDKPEAAGPRAHMVGDSPAFRETLDRLLLAAGTEAPALLQGETGTGKELAAAFIHRNSSRRDGPFQTLDCTVLTPELFENEVFGHARGAFTGSLGEKPGLFELADKGTLFLDEIGEMPLPLQAKLLRLLETGEFRRVGDTKMRRADVRVLCATNREIHGVSWFRKDLYYRIACMTVRLPNLSERRSDIPGLAADILERINRSSGHRVRIDPDALRILVAYDYPGNIRELRNILWVAAVNAADGTITGQLVNMALPRGRGEAEAPEHHGQRQVAVTAPTLDQPPPAREHHGVWNADQLAALLRRHQGNRGAVARELRVSERTIYRKLREFGLQALACGNILPLADMLGNWGFRALLA